MAEYTSIIATAKRLIQKKGRLITITRATATLADVNKPWRPTTGTSTEYSGYAVKIPFRPDQVEGYAFERGDELLYMATDFEVSPSEDDQFNWPDEGAWGIVAITTLSPSGENIFYQAQVRKWPRRTQ